MGTTSILVMSDLHLEQLPAWSLPETFPDFDIGVFAGDIAGSPAQAIESLAEAPGLARRPIVFVPGNHEFYRCVLEERLQDGRNACVGTTVQMLDRETKIIGGIRFVGAILWTDYALHGDPLTGQVACLRTLNDHRLIETTAARERRFLPGHAMMRHQADRAFIERELVRPFAGPTVVVTHHAPHRGSLHERHARDLASSGFVSDLSDLIADAQPALWVHGHVHDSFDYRVGATRVLCNPKGYGPRRPRQRSENQTFDAQMVVEV